MRRPHIPLRVVALAALALVAGVALGQQLSTRTLTGNEVVVAAIGGPGGGSQFVPLQQLRNAQGTTTNAATSGTVVTTTLTASFISTAACGGAMTLDLPPSPWDGEIFEWVNGSGSAFTTGCVVATTDGSTIVNGNAVTTLAAGGSTEWRYAIGTNSWYRMR